MKLTSSGTVFFQPTGSFLDYVQREFSTRPLIDVGAGIGLLTKVLRDKGMKCLPIDIYERDETIVDVAPLDATEMEFPSDCVPIIARPCHGYFVAPTVRNALTRVPFVLYVGLAKNFELDLDGLDFCKLEICLFNAGEDGEIVVKISKR